MFTVAATTFYLWHIGLGTFEMGGGGEGGYIHKFCSRMDF